MKSDNKMNSDNRLKDIDIKNRTCDCFDGSLYVSFLIK